MGPRANDPETRKTGYADAPPDPRDVRRAAGLFKVLSHPDRLRLACLLGDGREVTQKELVETLDWPQSTTARHLAALRRAGLVVAERDGPEVVLRLGETVGLELMRTVCDWLHGEAEEEPGADLDALSGFAPPPRRAAPARETSS